MTKFLTQNRLVRYLREAYAELRKVVWPNQQTIRRHTILVIGISIFVAIYFGVVDYLLNLALKALI